MGFDHVRLTIEPAPLFNWEDPTKLKTEYLRFLDNALDLILAQGLAVIVDIHPSDEFKIRLNSNDRQIEAFGEFWRTLAQHLSTRDPERFFLEVINEPMVEDGYRWFGLQGKLIAAMRAGAPQHTIIAAGHRWSGLAEAFVSTALCRPEHHLQLPLLRAVRFHASRRNVGRRQSAFLSKHPLPIESGKGVSRVLDTIQDEPARYNLLRDGEDRWNAARIDREISMAAAWGCKVPGPSYL